MFVFRQLGPETAEDAITSPRQVRCRRILGSRVQRRKHKFGRVEFVEVVEEGLFPGSGLGAVDGGCCGHCAGCLTAEEGKTGQDS